MYMKQMVIFDLDGVLVDAKEIHYNALNEALRSVDEKYCITLTEHLNIYDGLMTRYKLELISNNKGLPREFHNQIWDLKQTKFYGPEVVFKRHLESFLDNYFIKRNQIEVKINNEK
jgi:beta-phosphoglucomutase-like phosphatase (HAD superfamily)